MMFKTSFNWCVTNTTGSCISIRIGGIVDIYRRVLLWFGRNKIFISWRHFYHYLKKKIKEADKQNDVKNKNTKEYPMYGSNGSETQKCKTYTCKKASARSQNFISKSQFFMPFYFEHKHIQFLSIIANFVYFSQGKFV